LAITHKVVSQFSVACICSAITIHTKVPYLLSCFNVL